MLDLRDYKVTGFSLKTKKKELFGKWKDVDPNDSIFYADYVKLKRFLNENAIGSGKDFGIQVELAVSLALGLSIKGFDLIRDEKGITLAASKKRERLELVLFLNKACKKDK